MEAYYSIQLVGLMKEVPKYEIHDFEKIEVEIQAAINVN
jgi:hypothetical protein